MGEKIRLLGIAPYENMRPLMLEVAKQFSQIDLTVFVGDLQQGVELAKRNFYNDYDAIISRGGTAELLQKTMDIPVIEIAVSPIDIMRAMKLAENVSDHYAIVGFPSVTASARQLCQLMQQEIHIHTIQGEEQVEETLRKLQKKGTQAILCDMVTHTTAIKLGLDVVLITSGPESIQTAFSDAVRLCQNYTALREENRFLRSLIWNQVNQTVVFDDQGGIFFSTLENNSVPIVEYLRGEREHVACAGQCHVLKRLQNIQYSIQGRKQSLNQRDYVAYYFSESRVPSADVQRGIRYISFPEAEQEYNSSLYGVTGLMREVQKACMQINQRRQPVMVCGEDGCCKEQVVNYLYTTSDRKDKPLVIIDCFLANEKTWNHLINHYNSPLTQSGCTIFIKNVDVLSEEQRRQLLSDMLAMDVCARNRVMFSCVCRAGESVTGAGMDVVERLSCVILTLTPMRQQVAQIPAAANMYLSYLNTAMAKQIVGLEPQGLELLQQFDWPHNHTQFQRILQELTMRTDGPYISRDVVAEVLKREKTVATVDQKAEDVAKPLDLNRTLDQINREIIDLVLAEENGNQSRTAQRLGISRTTLWRLLNSK